MGKQQKPLGGRRVITGPGIQDLARMSLLTVMMIVSKFALSWLPNIELVSLLIILFTLHFGHRALYMIYTFVLVEGVMYGFTMWWFNYLYVWAVLYAIVCLCNKFLPGMRSSAVFWALVSGCFGLSFGTWCSIPYFFTLGLAGGVSYFIANIPFDIVHCLGNVVLTLLLFRLLDTFLNRFRVL